MKDWYGLASTYNNLSDIYMDLGKWNEAEKFAAKGLLIAQRNNYQRVLEELYFNNAKIAFRKGDYKTAAIYRDSGKVYMKKNMLEKANNNLQSLQMEYDVELKEAKIDALSKENQIKSLQLKQRNFALWTGGLGVILLSLLAWVSFRSYKRKQALRHQLEMTEEREQSTLALQHATEEERKRIAKDLHDGVGQQIAAIKLTWENLLTQWKKGNPPPKDDYSALSSLIDNTSSDVRSISHRMMPRALQEHGLVEATEEMLRLTLTPAGIQYRLEHFQLPKNLDKNLEVSLYRVLQELIKNIVKHSKAKNVGVQLMRVKNHLVLIVEDDGVGMNPSQNNSNGIGILSLKGRVNTIKGTINFEPSPNSGTLVTIRIPLDNYTSSTR